MAISTWLVIASRLDFSWMMAWIVSFPLKCSIGHRKYQRRVKSKVREDGHNVLRVYFRQVGNERNQSEPMLLGLSKNAIPIPSVQSAKVERWPSLEVHPQCNSAGSQASSCRSENPPTMSRVRSGSREILEEHRIAYSSSTLRLHRHYHQYHHILGSLRFCVHDRQYPARLH